MAPESLQVMFSTLMLIGRRNRMDFEAAGIERPAKARGDNV